MSAQRIYVPFMLFNMRMVNMQHLWSPSLEYLGKKTEKPNYFITVVSAKSRANWWEEPLLAPAWAAYDQLLQKSGMTPQHISSWPIKDGDMPPEPGKAPAEWAKGHWVLGGSSSQPIKAEIVQNGNVLPLPAKIGVKPGDFVALGASAAIKQNDPRAMKHFCNTVLFMGAGEEIAVGNSVSGAELMRTAQGQGLQVAGFAGSPGFGGAPQGGFPGPGQTFTPPGYAGAAQPNFGGQPAPGGFAGPQLGFTPPVGQFAPMTGNPAGPGYGVQAPGGPGFAGPVTYPSNPQGGPGFSVQQPGNFAPSGAPMGAPSTGPNFGPGSFPGQR